MPVCPKGDTNALDRSSNGLTARDDSGHDGTVRLCRVCFALALASQMTDVAVSAAALNMTVAPSDSPRPVAS